METEKIRVAVVSGSRSTREYLARELERYSNLRIVYQGSSLQTHFRKLRDSQPQVILLDTTTPGTLPHDLNPKFKKVRGKLPESALLLYTQLQKEDPFIKTATREGRASVIDERLAVGQIARIIQRISEGEQVIILYGEQTKHDLETYRPRRKETL